MFHALRWTATAREGELQLPWQPQSELLRPVPHRRQRAQPWQILVQRRLPVEKQPMHWRRHRYWIKAYLHPALLQIPGGKIFIKLPGFNFDRCHCRQGNWEIYLLHVEVRVSFGLVSSMEECLLYHEKFCSANQLDVYSCLRHLIIS